MTEVELSFCWSSPPSESALCSAVKPTANTSKQLCHCFCLQQQTAAIPAIVMKCPCPAEKGDAAVSGHFPAALKRQSAQRGGFSNVVDGLGPARVCTEGTDLAVRVRGHVAQLHALLGWVGHIATTPLPALAPLLLPAAAADRISTRTPLSPSSLSSLLSSPASPALIPHSHNSCVVGSVPAWNSATPLGDLRLPAPC